jgi:hypothetical protein
MNRAAATCTGNLVQGEGKKLLRCVSANASCALQQGYLPLSSFENKNSEELKRLGDVTSGRVPINGPGIVQISQRFRGPMLQVGARNLYTEARLMIEGIVVPFLQTQTWGTTRGRNSRAGSFFGSGI